MTQFECSWCNGTGTITQGSDRPDAIGCCVSRCHWCGGKGWWELPDE